MKIRRYGRTYRRAGSLAPISHSFHAIIHEVYVVSDAHKQTAAIESKGITRPGFLVANKRRIQWRANTIIPMPYSAPPSPCTRNQSVRLPKRSQRS